MENFRRAFEEIMAKTAERRARLLLHACCAPCSSYVLEYLNSRFDITLFYYNPNIADEDEYDRRAKELLRLVEELPLENPVKRVEISGYEPREFEAVAAGREECKEGGERCFLCYRLRLERTAQLAREQGFDYFCTTLSVSPHKNAQALNECGGELSRIYGVEYLYSDFKKKDGCKRSIELSKIYNLYRQPYCGCKFSKREQAAPAY